MKLFTVLSLLCLALFASAQAENHAAKVGAAFKAFQAFNHTGVKSVAKNQDDDGLKLMILYYDNADCEGSPLLGSVDETFSCSSDYRVDCGSVPGMPSFFGAATGGCFTMSERLDRMPGMARVSGFGGTSCDGTPANLYLRKDVCTAVPGFPVNLKVDCADHQFTACMDSECSGALCSSLEFEDEACVSAGVGTVGFSARIDCSSASSISLAFGAAVMMIISVLMF